MTEPSFVSITSTEVAEQSKLTITAIAKRRGRAAFFTVFLHSLNNTLRTLPDLDQQASKARYSASADQSLSESLQPT
jgi:hypothetical protein